MLLEALALYEGKARAANGRLPKVLMVVTGKGPDREKYMKEVERLQQGANSKPGWQYVRCISEWLEAADYPIMLGEIYVHPFRAQILNGVQGLQMSASRCTLALRRWIFL